jgi:hypothetical protein
LSPWSSGQLDPVKGTARAAERARTCPVDRRRGQAARADPRLKGRPLPQFGGERGRVRAVYRRVDVMLILERNGHVLLAERSGTGYADGAFNLPSGKLDPHEDRWDGEPYNAEPHSILFARIHPEASRRLAVGGVLRVADLSPCRLASSSRRFRDFLAS